MKTFFTHWRILLSLLLCLVTGITANAQSKLFGVTQNGPAGPSVNGTIFSIQNDGSGYKNEFSLPSTLTPGANPQAGVVNCNGKLYGLTNSPAILFEFDPVTGNYNTKYQFSGQNSDAKPDVDLVVNNGILYGVTTAGGANDAGMIFSYDPTKSGDSGFNDLYDFDGSGNGANAFGGLVVFNGKLYGTTSAGGNAGAGIIFSYDLSQTGAGAFTKIYDFDGSTAGYPYGSLIVYNNLLYGMGSGGGVFGSGSIFSFDPSKTGSTGFADLYDFDGGSNGGFPYGALVVFNSKMYGMTSGGGALGVGTIFSFDPSIIGNAAFTTLYDFDNVTGGMNYGGALIVDNNLLYGMTSASGATQNGVIFSYDPSKAGTAAYTDVHDFSALDGYAPLGSLYLNNGKFFGLGTNGGVATSGTMFSFDPTTAALSVLVNFNAPAPDNGPTTLISLKGKLYTTTNTLTLASYDPGTGTFQHLYKFQNGGPVGNTTKDGDNIYGAMHGATDSLYSYNPSSNTVKSYVFPSSIGTDPRGDLTFLNGKIYGSTQTGGTNGRGTLFSFDVTTQAFTVLFNYTSTINALVNTSPLVVLNNKIYGYGYLPTASPQQKYIFSFDLGSNTAATDYSFPVVSGTATEPDGNIAVVNGVFYGSTSNDGTFGFGTLFSYDPVSKAYTKLYDLTNATDRGIANLTIFNNQVYGVLQGNIQSGSVFSFDPANQSTQLNILHQFGGNSDGFAPTALIEYTTPVAQTITFADQTKTYGDADFAPGATSDNPTNPITYTSDNTNVATITTDGKIHIVAAGTANITASQAADDTHLAATVTKVLTVNKATPVITFASAITATYGDADVTPAATSTDAVTTTPVTFALSNQKDASGAAATIATITNGTLQILEPGTAAITASQAGSDNYNAANNVPQTLTINKKALTVKANDAAKTFGAANPIFTTTYQGLVTDGDAAKITGTAVVNVSDPNNGGADPGQNAQVGTYNLVPDVSPLVSSYYTFTPANGILTVTQGSQMVTVTNLPPSPTYGDSPAPITVSSPGTGDITTTSDNANVATVTKDGSGNYTINIKGAGTATITFSQAADANHAAGMTTQTITVAKKTLASVVVDDKSILAGQPLPTFTATVTGFIAGDDISAITPAPAYSTTAANTNTAGTFDINIDNYSSLTANNYTLPADYTKGKLTIGSLAFNNITKTYGDATFDPGATSTESGTPSYTITNPNIATYDAGTGLVTIKGAGTTNITATINGSSVTRTLTVNQKTVSVTADNATKNYGDANPTIAIHYSGFINGDNETTLIPFTPATAITGVTTSSNAGNYPIILSGASAANYTFTYATGANLMVNKAQLSIAADNQTKVYGQTNPALTVTYTGFVNGDDQSKLNPQPLAITIANTASGTGTYPITLNTITATNYTITASNGILTVTPAALTVTANSFTRDRGQPNPAFTVSYAGFVNSDTQNSLSTPATATTTATPSSPAGSYQIVPSGAVSANYTFNYVNGNLTVNGNQLITFNPLSVMTYGDADFDPQAASDQGVVPAYTTSNPSVAAIIGGKVHIAGAGTAVITATFAGNGTYLQSTANQTLTVQPHGLTVAADNQSKIQGQPNPILTLTYNGFVNGDLYNSPNVFTVQPTVTTTATTTSTSSTYPISVGGGSSNNYSISYISGTLTVTAARSLTFATVSPATYGDPDFDAGITNATQETILYSSSNPNVAVINGGKIHILGAGTTTLTATLPANTTYPTATVVSQVFTVNPANLVVTANDLTKIYLQPNPSLTLNYQGFVLGDNASKLTQQPIAATTANSSSYQGTYPITVSGGASLNYTFQYVAGTLSIVPPGGAELSSLNVLLRSRSQLDVNVYLLVQQPVNLMLYDVGGRLLNSQRPPLYRGFNTYSFDVSMLPVGTYIVKAVADGLNQTQKILVH